MVEIKCTSSDTLPLNQLTEFQGGLKERTDEDIKEIIASIDDYGFVAPFFVWKCNDINYVLDGHGRLAGLKELQRRGESLPEKWPVPESRIDFTAQEMQARENIRKSLKDEFLVPPFSVLDTRQGYWQDRKKQWKLIGIKSDEGRDNKMLDHLRENAAKMNGGKSTLSQQSIFDPVLCETMYTWFCFPHGQILDPFSGGSVRGIVASYKHMKYTGFDIRPEQIEANEKQRSICEGNEYSPSWIVHDSAKMNEVLPSDFMADMVFSCPPYADLEKYSDIQGDISNMDYGSFIEAYRNIINISCSRLKENRFAVFVVGEVRNKKTGQYYSFIPDTIKAFQDAGLKYYNELILVNVAGGKAYTAGHDAKQSRKIAKVHQNILAFLKGDADEALKVHEQALVFLKGDSRQANSELGPFVCNNAALPELPDIDDDTPADIEDF